MTAFTKRGERGAASTAATVGVAILCMILVVAVVVWNAPANWLARELEARTGGVLLLADADGTIWTGSAVLGIAAPAGTRSEATAVADARLALPGRIRWQLAFDRTLAPVLHLSHDGTLAHPVDARASGGGIVVDAGAATLPAALLVLAGPPFNTLRPEGQATLRWSRLDFGGDGRIAGEGTLQVTGLAIGLSPVRPLGTYLVSWSGGATGLVWQLATERGPLMAVGNGVWGDRARTLRVVLRAAADASLPVKAQLGPLLDVIGRRGPDEAVIESGRS